jgi:SAM-dependent methyltransferase
VFKETARKVARRLKSFAKDYSFVSDAAGSEWDAFYQRFEKRFRGAPELIEARLKSRYSGVLNTVKEKSKAFEGGLVLDLGCGRGEFLEIAQQLGFKTCGVDMSGAMVQETINKGHPATCSDVLKYLKAQAKDSATVISLFHVIEHCPAKYSWRLFQEVHRVLMPGGVFICETPSLFSVWASQRQFYLDPTHERPVHPEYMSFLAEDAGFSKVETLEFDEVESTERAKLAGVPRDKKLGEEFKKLEKWLYGPMDIAIVATK